MFKAVFQLNVDDPQYGNIILTYDTGNPAQLARFKVIGPLGIIKDFPAPGVFDIDAANGVTESLVAIPTVTNLDFQKGDYEFEVEDLSVNPATSTLFEFNFCPKIQTGGGFVPSVTIEFNCLCGKGVVTDSSDYPSDLDVEREMTLISPMIPGYPQIPNVVTTNPVIEFPITHSNVIYVVQYQAELITEVDNFCVIEKAKGTVTETVVCTYNMCGLVKCMEKQLSTDMAAASANGGWNNLPNSIQEFWSSAMIYMQIHDYHLRCKNWDQVEELFEKLKKLFKCDCECAGEDSGISGPVLIENECGIGSAGIGTVPIVSGAFPIDVQFNQGEYVVSLQQTFIDTIFNQLGEITTDFNALSDTLDTLSFSDWTVLNYPELNNDWTNDPNTPLTWRRNANELQLTGYIRQNTAVLTPCITNVFFTDEVAGYDPTTIFHPSYSLSGVLLGFTLVYDYAAANNLPSPAWGVLFIPNANYNAPETIIINMQIYL